MYLTIIKNKIIITFIYLNLSFLAILIDRKRNVGINVSVQHTPINSMYIVWEFEKKYVLCLSLMKICSIKQNPAFITS